MENISKKSKVMLHYILPPATSGPNTSMERIESSWLKEYYQFGRLVQDERPGKFNVRLLRKMIRQVKEFEPDIVHVSGLQSAGFYAVLAAKLGGCKKIITTVRGSSVDAIGFNKYAKLIFRYVIEPLTMQMSSAVYTVCNEMAQKFGIEKKRNYVGVIHNPAPNINLEDFDREDFRKEIGATKDNIIVACVGRMTYDKGISFVIEAIKGIQNEKAIFVFVGDGPYCEILKDELKQEITLGRVFVLGKRNDVFRILSGSDVFLFATLHENLSNALLEACVMGLSIVATSVGGNIEVISDQINGILIPPSDTSAIIVAINRLCENESDIKILGKAARETVIEKFSQKKIYQELKDVYHSLLN
ncbi:MAG: glycosyltransferase family 4 protein [Clostridiaceae bacterium]|nr:glycosyltransferase family 4 protein [Clostridiaceae bacterium]